MVTLPKSLWLNTINVYFSHMLNNLQGSAGRLSSCSRTLSQKLLQQALQVMWWTTHWLFKLSVSHTSLAKQVAWSCTVAKNIRKHNTTIFTGGRKKKKNMKNRRQVVGVKMFQILHGFFLRKKYISKLTLDFNSSVHVNNFFLFF